MAIVQGKGFPSSPAGIVDEEFSVRLLGDAIGYGRVMQLAEQIWNKKTPGAALSVGCCTAFLVDCPCPDDGKDENGHCDWCCGSGRVTKKVLLAMTRPT